jgi:glucose-6-phosphate 1-dehydrogenase
MIQSHLLVVLALTVMEPPSSIDPDDLRGAMAQALRSVAVHDVSQSRRAQYTAGRIGDRPVPSYRDEHGVPTQSTTETLAETVLSVDNWRFAGVPVRLRSGKALGDLRKEIVIRFRDVPHLPVGLRGREGPVRLRIALSPEQLNLDVMLNGEGDPFTLDRMTLEAGFGPGELGPYGEVIHGILNSDPTLSLRSDMVEECWRIVTPVLDAWRAGVVPLDTYRAGGSGPASWSGAD